MMDPQETAAKTIHGGADDVPRILSGMRPTGKLHLGNYMGALKNWVDLQDQNAESGASKYASYFFIADYHALTTDYADPREVKHNTEEMILDWLAAGLTPEKSVMFVQSHVPQHAELHLLFSMITPLGWLERVPSYKDQQENLAGKDLATYGFLGYPLLQAADILVYQAQFVPVGSDQVAHVELTREVARRFNHFYAGGRAEKRDLQSTLSTRVEKDQAIFPEPDALLTPSPKLPGTDGRKMSKSYGNTIFLTDPEAEVRKKLKTMVTDPARVRRTDPGNPEICPVGDLHKVFSSSETLQKVWDGCTTAGIGCIECKGWAADGVIAVLEPMQNRRKTFSNEYAQEVLADGEQKATARAEQTMHLVRDAMGLSQKGLGEIGLGEKNPHNSAKAPESFTTVKM